MDVAVDEHWSSWSEWSECDTECKRYKKRKCDNSDPSYEGENCSGKEIQIGNCSGGLCNTGQ